MYASLLSYELFFVFVIFFVFVLLSPLSLSLSLSLPSLSLSLSLSLSVSVSPSQVGGWVLIGLTVVILCGFIYCRKAVFEAITIVEEGKLLEYNGRKAITHT